MAPAAATAAAGVIVTLPGGLTRAIPAAALTAGATGTVQEECALRARPGEEPGPSDHRGLPVEEALERYAEVRKPFGYLTIPRPDGTVAYLPGEWFAKEATGESFEGCEHALFSVDSEVTKFFRPPLLGDPGDVNAEDNIATTGGEALAVGVHEGAIVEVAVTASSTQAAAGSPVQFSASVPGGGAGFIWSFGDGSVAEGETVSHTFAGSGSYEVRATAIGSDESGGESAPVTVVVGDPPDAPRPGATTSPAPPKRRPAGAPGKGGRGRGGKGLSPGPGGSKGARAKSDEPGPRRPDRSPSAPRRDRSPSSHHRDRSPSRPHPDRSPSAPRHHRSSSRPRQDRSFSAPRQEVRPPAPQIPEPAASGSRPEPGDPAQREPAPGAEANPSSTPATRRRPSGSRHAAGGRLVEGRLVGDDLGSTTIEEALGGSAAGRGLRSAPGGDDGGGIAVPVGALIVVGLLAAGALFEARRGRVLR